MLYENCHTTIHKVVGFFNFKHLLQLVVFLFLLASFSNLIYAEDTVIETTENTVEFNWEEKEDFVISNIAITTNETYTYDTVDIKFSNLPTENLKLQVYKINKQDLPEETNATSNAYDIKLIDENNEEVIESFDISITFHDVEDTDNISVISFENIESFNEAKIEEFEIDDGNIVIETDHLTIFVVTKIVDHTSGSGEKIYSNTPPDDPLPTTINVNNNSDTGGLKTKGWWPTVSTEIGNDYVDFHFGDITNTLNISNITFITNLRVQVAAGSGGTNKNDFNAKLYAKKSDNSFTDLGIDKYDLVPNLNTDQSGFSSNYELISIDINPTNFSNLDLNDFVVRYSLAGEHLGPHPPTVANNGLIGYFDYVALDVQYITDSIAPTVDLVFPATGTSATSFQAVFSENVNQSEAENPANYFLNNWPGVGGSGNLTEDATITYDSLTFTATITFTDSAWYISPEQQWGVENIHDIANNLMQINPYTEYSTPMTNPVTTDSGIDTNWRNSSVTVTLTCTDTNGSGCKSTYYTTDGTTPTTSSASGNTITLNLDGIYTIKYFSTDNAGNTEAIKTATNTVKIDTTNPTGTILINNNDTYTNNKTVTLNLTATDNLSGVYKMSFSNDGVTFSSWENFSTSKTWTLQDTTDETKTVYVKFNDNAENEFITSDSIILDTTAPVSTITLPSNTENNTITYLNSWNGIISGTSSDNFQISNVQISIMRESDGYYFNGTTWVTSATEVLINTTTTDLFATWSYDINSNPTGNETYIIISHATDKAGNFENSYKITLIYDITIPQVNLSINPTNPNGNNEIYVSKPKITLNGNDNYDIDYIEYQLNSTVGLWTKYLSTIEIQEGATKFYYRSIDKAGNISNIGLKNISIDLTTPSGIENISAKFNSVLNETSVNWEISDDDIYAIDVYKSESNNVDQSSSNFFVSVDKNTESITDDNVERGNTYYYLLITYDKAGNEGDSVKISITVPENEAEEIIVTTEPIPAPIVIVTNNEILNEQGEVEGIITENTDETKEKVLGIENININLDDTTENFNFINFLKSYWWLLLLIPSLFWFIWWLKKVRK